MTRRYTPSTAQVRAWEITRAPTSTGEPAAEAAAAPRIFSAYGNPVVRHGFTMAHLDRLARTVVVANAQWWSGGDRYDQVDTARSGILEHLCTVEDVPSANDLLAAGTQALVEEVKGWRRSHGIRDSATQVGPRFAAYWYDPPAEPWDERLTDMLAVRQVLARLTKHQRDAIVALAAHDDYAAAANSLGLKYGTFTARIRLARNTIFGLWYAPETAPTVRHTDRRVGSYATELATHCAAGHEWTIENTRWDQGRTAAAAKVRRCRACERDRGRRRAAARQTAAAA